MTLGATPFSIYLTSAPDQVALRDRGRRRPRSRSSRRRSCRSSSRPRRARADRRRVGRGPGLRRRAALARGRARRHPHADLHQSGTTGPPKGVQIAHRNQMAAVDAVEQRVGFPDGSRVISWLPSAHVAERTAHHYLPIVYAMTITSCPDPRQIGDLPAGGQADLVLRRPARVGEAQGRRRGQARRRRGRAEAARGRRARGSSSSRPASRSRTQLAPVLARRRGEAVRAAAGRDRARRGRSWSTSAPRRRRARCSSSSTPSASRWPRSGG